MFALMRGAEDQDASRAWRFAERVWPIVIWQIEQGEVSTTAEGVSDACRIFTSGAARSALRDRAMPNELRQPMLNVLHPLREGNADLIWWEDYAIPNWVTPFCWWLQDGGQLEQALRCEAALPLK